MTTESSPAPTQPRPSRFVRILRRLLFVSICLATVLGVFYTVENWRGKQAWLSYKKELEAKGEQLDIDAFIPASVPDEENMLKVPIISRWVTRIEGTNPPTIKIPETGMLYGDWSNAKPTELAEWITFFYSSVISNESAAIVKANERREGEEVMPLMSVEGAPLWDAIQYLARQAQFKITFDASVTNAAAAGEITFRWENLTPRQAFYTLLDNYSLDAIPDRQQPTNNANQLLVVHANNGAAERNLLMTIVSTNSLRQHGTNSSEIFPLITIEDAPLSDAIRVLARQAEINFQFDPKLDSKLLSRTTTLRRENVTTRMALDDLLKEKNLTAVSVGSTTNASPIYRIGQRVKTAAEILKQFEKFDAEFKELYAACAKPKARFDFDYKALPEKMGQFPNFVNLRALAQSLTLRASAELALDQGDAGMRDIKTCLRLADCLTNEPTLVSGMIRVALNGLIVGPIWEGLAARRWNKEQLSEMQEILSAINLLKDTAKTMRGERANQNFHLTAMSQREIAKTLKFPWLNNHEEVARRAKRLAVPFVPRGWIYQNLVLMNRLYQENMLDGLDLQQSIVSPQTIDAGQKKTDAAYQKTGAGNFLASLIYPGFSKAFKVTAQNQTYVNEAMIACALERYRLAHGSFPETLEALTPKLIAKVPHDVINGQPLKYRRTDDGQYVLYSVAWDEKDDGGRPVPQTYKGDEIGDWVWRFPKAMHDSSSK
ncbi:MAG: hypothetical protein JWM68_3411 [Verrucomicrobiales bacterium]|nr:hypothetical protein [Verrucomicrobiales bacterium]